MCRAMEEMRNQAAFKTRADDAVQIMKRFNVTAQETQKALPVSETEEPRYLAAI